MAITVTEKEHWKERIERKLNQKIESLYATSGPSFMKEVQDKARDKALESLGIADVIKRRKEAEQEAERCTNEAKWMTQRAVAILRGLQPDEVGGNEWHWQSEVQAAIERRAKLAEQDILADDELGRRILKVQAEKEELLDTVWLATSPRQVRDLWQDVCRLAGDELTSLQREALARPATDDTKE